MLRIALGADHSGFSLKNELSDRLPQGYEILDLGAHVFDPTDDYPDFEGRHQCRLEKVLAIEKRVL